MIQVTRLNHKVLVLNSDLIEYMESTPDTVITLTTGQKIVGVGQDADGKPWERDITSGSPILPGKNSWIEIRRQ